MSVQLKLACISTCDSYKTVGTRLVFSVGDKEVNDFRMIERHYFKGRLLKSYDFLFNFCIPNTTNEWEVGLLLLFPFFFVPVASACWFLVVAFRCCCCCSFY